MTIATIALAAAFVASEGGTDASAWVLANMPAEKRQKLLRELFTPEGCNLGAVRLNVGASDYSTGLYKSLPLPGEQWSVSTLVFK